MHTRARFVVALVGLLALSVTHARVCDELQQNLLTSIGCPSRCSTSPCLLFSPTQKEQCQASTAAGDCYVDEAFVVPSASSSCNLTFQCLENLVNSTNKTWRLVVSPTGPQDTITTVPVTQIKQLAYPTSGIDTVAIVGGRARRQKGDITPVQLDNSVLETPFSVLTFVVADVDAQAALEKADFSRCNWTSVVFNNVNLDEVPATLATLSLQYADLGNNNIANISDPKPFQKTTTLNLAKNNLKDLQIPLLAVESLNVSGNPLTKIPDTIFTMKNLTTLAMRDTNITDVVLTDPQLFFLDRLQTFDANFNATKPCPRGTGRVTIGTDKNNSVVCVPFVGATKPPAATTRPSEPNQPIDQDGPNKSLAVIVIIVVGVLGCSLLVVFVFRRKRTISKPNVYELAETPTTTSLDFDGWKAGEDTSRVWNDPALLMHRIDYAAMETTKLLSRGSTSEVWLGVYHDGSVAVKRLLRHPGALRDAVAFATTIKTITRLEHTNIVRFIGVAWERTQMIQVVSEFVECGDLRTLLDMGDAVSLTWENYKCQVAIDVASALDYIHQSDYTAGIGGLTARNVLLSSDGTAKLNLVRLPCRDLDEARDRVPCALRWVAPEVVIGGPHSSRSDMYAFGVLLTELDTRKQPFFDARNTNGAPMQDMLIAVHVAKHHLRPTLSEDCPPEIGELVASCLHEDPVKRPTPANVTYILRAYLKSQ